MSLFNSDKELEDFIARSVDGLSKGQIREVRLMAKDLIAMTQEKCRSSVQSALEEINQITKKSD